MKKRGKLSLFVLTLMFLVAVAVTHTALTFTQTISISGRATGNLSENGIILTYNEMTPLSKAIIVGEWLLIFFIISTAIIRKINQRIKIKNDLGDINFQKNYHKKANQTDIDMLHEVLKNKKSLRISSVSELFKINEELAMEWGKILEAGDLATIQYPRMGEAKIVINENEK